jgi:hypothetical protein
MKKWFPWIGFAVLALLVFFQFYNPFGLEPGDGRGEHVGEFVPGDLEGWQVTDKDLGATESIRERAADILDLDDFVYRNYSRNGGEEFFEVYVAYWGPGKASILEVSSHTPDRCWTENGWSPVAREHKVRKEVRGEPLIPSEWRIFEIQGNEQFVHYWHLVGGESYEYGKRSNAFPTPYSYVRDLLRSHVFGTGEQYFIRINTNVPFDRLWNNPGFQEVVANVADLGLRVERADLGGEDRAEGPVG